MPVETYCFSVKDVSAMGLLEAYRLRLTWPVSQKFSRLQADIAVEVAARSAEQSQCLSHMGTGRGSVYLLMSKTGKYGDAVSVGASHAPQDSYVLKATAPP
jgi:hypothetical protein